MDIKVYHKETVSQPQGNIDVLVADVIDIYPMFNDGGEITLDTDTLILNDGSSFDDETLILNEENASFNDTTVELQTKYELKGCDLIEGTEEQQQALILATIYQKGQDPCDKNDGIQWAEATIGEVTTEQIVTQLQVAVANVSTTAQITFDVIENNGNSYLTYNVKAV